MCTIAVKKFGAKLPDNFEEYIKTAFTSQRDGIGIAIKIKTENVVRVRRSVDGPTPVIETFNEVLKILENKKLDTTDDMAIIIHGRLGTSGKATNLNVHPFKIDRTATRPRTSKMDDHETFGVNSTAITECSVFAHNGVIFEFSGHEKYCDTLIFGASVLAKKYVSEIDFEKLPGKIAILTPYANDNVYLTPNFVKDTNSELLLSNSSCVPRDKKDYDYSGYYY